MTVKKILVQFQAEFALDKAIFCKLFLVEFDEYYSRVRVSCIYANVNWEQLVKFAYKEEFDLQIIRLGTNEISGILSY